MKRQFKRLLLVLLSLYALWIISVFFLQRAFFFPAYLAEEKGGLESKPSWVEQWQFPIEEGFVYAWYTPGVKEGPFYAVLGEGASPTVIFAHGNGEVLEQQLPLFRSYREAGINILSVEYRGYGHSGGHPSENALLEDLERAYERLVRQPNVRSDQIFFHGRSIGTGVMCAMSRRINPAGLILESPFLSLSGFYVQLGVPSFLARDPFESLKNIESYVGPSVVFHGLYDELIPFEQGAKIAQALGTQVIASQAGHTDIPRDGAYWDPIFEMIRKSYSKSH